MSGPGCPLCGEAWNDCPHTFDDLLSAPRPDGATVSRGELATAAGNLADAAARLAELLQDAPSCQRCNPHPPNWPYAEHPRPTAADATAATLNAARALLLDILRTEQLSESLERRAFALVHSDADPWAAGREQRLADIVTGFIDSADAICYCGPGTKTCLICRGLSELPDGLLDELMRNGFEFKHPRHPWDELACARNLLLEALSCKAEGRELDAQFERNAADTARRVDRLLSGCDT